MHLTNLLALILSSVLGCSARISKKWSSQKPDLTSAEKAVWDTRYETLVVSEAYLTVNCTGTRRSVVINGTSPGPQLTFYTQQRAVVTVVNNLPHDNFTMHWHGLSMAATPWSDGTPLISQWPIPPNSSFQYEFILYPDDAGTYFYHSHVDLQISTASGPLLIIPRAHCQISPHIPRDMIMYLQDYWYKTDDALLKGLLEDPFAWVGTSSEIFLNGRSNSTSGGFHCSTKFPVIVVDPATTYRLRWIHGGSLMYISAGIEAHNLTIIEADGTDLVPETLDHIELSPGQRMSTLITTKSQREVLMDGRSGLYVINLSSRWRNPGVQNFAVLRYSFANATTDHGYIDMFGKTWFNRKIHEFQLPEKTFGWKDKSFKAIDASAPPENINQTMIILKIQQRSWGVHGSQWRVNGRTYHEHNVTNGGPPYLIKLYQGLETLPLIKNAETGPDIYDPVSGTYVLEAGQVVDIVLQNIPGDANTTEIHPWHFHSRKFWIMAQGQGAFNHASLQAGTFSHPYKRDMVNVYPAEGKLEPDSVGGWSMIRYQASAEDAGVFPLHCHMSPHVAMGMLVLFTISPSTLPSLLQSYEPYVMFNGEMYGKKDYIPPEPTYFLDRVQAPEGTCS